MGRKKHIGSDGGVGQGGDHYFGQVAQVVVPLSLETSCEAILSFGLGGWGFQKTSGLQDQDKRSLLPSVFTNSPSRQAVTNDPDGK